MRSAALKQRATASRALAPREGRSRLERAKRFELSTPTLARLCSTPELRPLGGCDMGIVSSRLKRAVSMGFRTPQAPFVLCPAAKTKICLALARRTPHKALKWNDLGAGPGFGPAP